MNLLEGALELLAHRIEGRLELGAARTKPARSLDALQRSSGGNPIGLLVFPVDLAHRRVTASRIVKVQDTRLHLRSGTAAVGWMITISVNTNRTTIKAGNKNPIGNLLLLPAGSISHRHSRNSSLRSTGVRKDGFLRPATTGKTSRQCDGSPITFRK